MSGKTNYVPIWDSEKCSSPLGRRAQRKETRKAEKDADLSQARFKAEWEDWKHTDDGNYVRCAPAAPLVVPPVIPVPSYSERDPATGKVLHFEEPELTGPIQPWPQMDKRNHVYNPEALREEWNPESCGNEHDFEDPSGPLIVCDDFGNRHEEEAVKEEPCLELNLEADEDQEQLKKAARDCSRLRRQVGKPSRSGGRRGWEFTPRPVPEQIRPSPSGASLFASPRASPNAGPSTALRVDSGSCPSDDVERPEVTPDGAPSAAATPSGPAKKGHGKKRRPHRSPHADGCRCRACQQKISDIQLSKEI